MKLILIESVEKLGLPGDVVNVRDGYARNFLLPAKKALRATDDNVRQLEHQKRIAESRRRKVVEDLQVRRDSLDGAEVSFVEKVSDTGRLYGSVSARRVADALAETYGELQSGWVQLSAPIREPGSYDVVLHLAPELEAHVTVHVEPEQGSSGAEGAGEEAPEEGEDAQSEPDEADEDAEEEPEDTSEPDEPDEPA